MSRTCSTRRSGSFEHTAQALPGWRAIVDELVRLESSSRRLQVSVLGESTRGLPYIAVHTHNAGHLPRPADHAANLPRQRTHTRARRKLVVLVTAGAHASEIGGVGMLVDLLRRIAQGTDDRLEQVLRAIDLVVIPCHNPDGFQLMIEQYHAAKRDGVAVKPGGLSHWYAGADLCRDAFAHTQLESHHLGRLLYGPDPPDVYVDIHQMLNDGPRVILPPYPGPLPAHVAPEIMAAANSLGQLTASRLALDGKGGVMTGERFPVDWQGAHHCTALRRDIVAVLIEVATSRLFDTVVQREAGHRAPDRGGILQFSAFGDPAAICDPPKDVRARRSYPSPWRGGVWSYANVLDYHYGTFLALLEAASLLAAPIRGAVAGARRKLLDASNRDRAYWILPDQRDPSAVAALLATLEKSGVVVRRVVRGRQARATRHSSPAYVIPFRQPAGRWLQDVMEPQICTASAPPSAYDITTWCLPMLAGVEVEARQGLNGVVTTNRLAPRRRAPHRRSSTNGRLLVSRDQVGAYRLANRALTWDAAAVTTVTQSVRIGRSVWAKGSFVIRATEGNRRELDELARSTGTHVIAARRIRSGEEVPIYRRPCVVLEPQRGHVDAGWTRWSLDQFEMPYTVRHLEDLSPADLSSESAVIMPDIMEVRAGLPHRAGEALDLFVRSGGTLICLGGACAVAIDLLELPLTDHARVSSGHRHWCSGAMLWASVDRDHPLTRGLPPELPLLCRGAGALRVHDTAAVTGQILASYRTEHVVASGLVPEPRIFESAVAAAVYAVGTGRAILLASRVQYRGQTRASFPLLFNGLYREEPAIAHEP